MLRKIKSVVGQNNNVFKNFLALGVLQGTNFIIPLILMPYLNSTVGIDKFGIISFIQVVMLFLANFTDYGFNISATREISLNKTNPEKISQIFSSVYLTKFFLNGVSFLIILGLIVSIPKFQKESLSLLLGFTIVLGQSFLPIWFFQGMEKMKYITILNFVTKVLFTLLIFIFVKQPEDYPLVLLFYGLGNLVSGLIGFGFVIKKYQIQVHWTKVKTRISTELQNGKSLFLSNLSVIIFTNSNILILSLFASDLVLGYYSNAERIVFASWQVLTIFSQAIYPHICNLTKGAFKKIISFFKDVYIPFIVLVFIGSILMFIFSDEIVLLLVNKHEPSISFLLKVMAFLPLIVGLNIPATQILLAFNLRKEYMKSSIGGAIFCVLLNLILGYYFIEMGTAITVMLTEVYITIALNYFVFKNYQKIKKNEV